MPITTSAMGLSVGKYKPILRVLGDGQHEDKTIKMISEGTRLDKAEVIRALDWFWDNGLSQKNTTESGTYWSLTEAGWRIYNSVEAAHEKQ